MLTDYRSRFGFKTGTTSFIIHDEEDNLVKNCEFLKDKVLEVQLLFFGKDYLDEMLSPALLQRLKSIHDHSGLVYSVHLPIDMGFLAEGPETLDKKTDIIYRILDDTAFLDVKSYILHLDRSLGFQRKPGLVPSPLLNQKELDLLNQSILLLKQGLGHHFKQILLENTDYDLTLASAIIDTYDLSVCLDFGHLQLLHLPLQNFRQSFDSRIKMAHVHGFQHGKDHQSLLGSPVSYLHGIKSFLTQFTGSVIIEVFSEKDLCESLALLDMELPKPGGL